MCRQGKAAASELTSDQRILASIPNPSGPPSLVSRQSSTGVLDLGRSGQQTTTTYTIHAGCLAKLPATPPRIPKKQRSFTSNRFLRPLQLSQKVVSKLGASGSLSLGLCPQIPGVAPLNLGVVSLFLHAQLLSCTSDFPRTHIVADWDKI